MAYSLFHDARLAAVAAVVPKDAISLDDEAGFYGNDPKKVRRVKKMAGLDRRRYAPEGVTASDLCIQAAERIFADLHVDRSGIDALIYITQTPDHPAPATAFAQQRALGLSRDCALFDVNLGCAGYIYGLWLACCMLGSGACSQVLLLAGDAGFRQIDPANRIIAPIFGDSGTASLLTRQPGAPALSFSLGNDGSGYEAIIRPGGGARLPHVPAADGAYREKVADASGNPWSLAGLCNIWMDGKAVFDFTMTELPGHIGEHLRHAGMNPADLDYLLLHQANRQIIENIAIAAGFSQAQAPWETLSKYGNQACASLPNVICDQLADYRPEEPLSLMLCGYGIGFSWGSVIGNFTGLHVLGTTEFAPERHYPGYAEQIEYWHKKFRGE